MKVSCENTFSIISEVMLPDVFPIVVDLDKSQGNYISDALTGKRYLDCFSYIASNPIGHNHPGMFEPQFEKKLLRAARSKPSSSDLYTTEFAEFVQIFKRMGMPAPFNHLFLVEGGAVAVENALKAAFDWKIRLNQRANPGKEVGTQILHFEQAFHGRCGYTLSITNTSDPKKTKLFPKFPWPRVSTPKQTFPLTPENVARTKELEARAEEEIRRAFHERGEDIAAIIIEPIQGEGGDNHFSKEFHHLLRKIADEQEVMLIHDEVQCGAGLTGRFWAHEHYGVQPDIICFGKKLQVCGIVVGPKIDTVENNVFVEKSRINSTWGGSLTDMVRAARYLEIIESENLLENARMMGKLVLGRLHDLETKFPHLISNVRGLGLMCAFDAPTVAIRDKLIDELFKRETIVLKCGDRSLRLRPSLTFSKEDADALFERFEDCLKAVSD